MSRTHPLRLNNESLASVGAAMPTPAYDRGAVVPRIVHLGVGGFHRAHLAAYTDELLSAGVTDWAIRGVGLTSADATMAATMRAQDGLYTLVARGRETEEARIVGSIVDYVHAPDGAGDLCTVVAQSDCRIVSMTVTENGYHYRADARELDVDHPAIRQDLSDPASPKTPVGVIFRIAELRSRAGRTLPTFLSCDNIPHNGSTLRKLVLTYAGMLDPELANAIEDTARFPSCMVDRITPATTDADRDYVTERWNIADRWPVVCEDFRQWYVEDKFRDGRPDWDRVGAVFVSDVTPFETMKIRLLNGSHSALAYAAYLLGYRRVDEAMIDPEIGSFVRRYMAEIEPTVGTVPGVDLNRYEDDLVQRFSNPAIGDQLLRLAEDGSRKIPNMMLEPMSELARARGAYRHGAFALAAWIRFLRGTDESGARIEIGDPAAERLHEAAMRCERDTRPFVEGSAVFPEELVGNVEFVSEIDGWYERIGRDGTRAALGELLQQSRGREGGRA